MNDINLIEVLVTNYNPSDVFNHIPYIDKTTVYILFNQNIYIIGNSNNEHLEFKKELENLIYNKYKNQVMTNVTMINLEQMIKSLLYKYQYLIVFEDSLCLYSSIEHILLSKELYFDKCKNIIGRIV